MMGVILTGGPGGGKSSVLDELRKRGYPCVAEVARDLIKDEVARGGDALPWENAEKFRDKMFREQLRVSKEQDRDAITFFDRGPIDCVAYSRLIEIPVTAEIDQACKDLVFHPVVFVTPPWEEIYRNDAERKQSFAEAVATYEQIVESYREYGYEAIDLPLTSVVARVDFILGRIAL